MGALKGLFTMSLHLLLWLVGEIKMPNCLEIFTLYRCRHCGEELTLQTRVGHTKDYECAREYALVSNEDNNVLRDFEELHTDHIYTYDLKLVPIGLNKRKS